MSAKKRAAKKKARKPATSKKKASKISKKKKTGRKAPKIAKKSVRTKGSTSKTRTDNKPIRTTRPDRDVESGDLQGLSRRERADSESVDELLEEGNAFEAGIVEGVEQADDSDGREVHTREVPEDDVPEEYLDEE
ncbi:MAG TPA: hypothetical protein VGG14_15975 [Candidatus Sulfotelmatobacter sp.]